MHIGQANKQPCEVIQNLIQFCILQEAEHQSARQPMSEVDFIDRTEDVMARGNLDFGQNARIAATERNVEKNSQGSVGKIGLLYPSNWHNVQCRHRKHQDRAVTVSQHGCRLMASDDIMSYTLTCGNCRLRMIFC